MTYLAVGLLLLVFVLLVQREKDGKALERLMVAFSVERGKLLDRIQFPDQRQFEPGEVIVHDQPHDSAEMAFVGGIVPEFVSVGSPED